MTRRRDNEGSGPRRLTAREQRVVDELRAIAPHWPPTIMLVSMDGNLSIVDTAAFNAGNDQNLNGAERQDTSLLAEIPGIPNDGGSW